MPHVVIEGQVDVGEFFRGLEPIQERDSSGIRKITDAYVNTKGNSVLLESVVVENGLTQKFMIAVSTKGAGVTVRLLPLTDPEKTPGVKQLMADVARQIIARFPGATFGKTNLQEFLGE
ncbi:MAG: hypothetical protein DHS20C21_11240 [Gemmatimonadota bacterium]|nr:MAG: hypothetical protein DHS20C21_11240 [Gemmatimonadota bacterium]